MRAVLWTGSVFGQAVGGTRHYVVCRCARAAAAGCAHVVISLLAHPALDDGRQLQQCATACP